MSLMNKLKERWNLKSGWQVLAVLVVFSCTGMSVLFAKEPLFTLLGLDESTAPWVRTAVYWLTIIPLYQVLLLIYAAIFGQLAFFWEFEKRSMGRLLKLFPKRS